MANETKPPTKMGKQELRAALMASGYTEEQLLDDNGKNLKRLDLLELYQANKQGESGLTALSSVEEEEDDVGIAVEQITQVDQETTIKPETKEMDKPLIELGSSKTEKIPYDFNVSDEPPTPSDSGWTQYVLGKFLEDEVDGKNPRVEGLRRVASELVGELIEEGCDLIAAPTEENRFRACVKAWGVFETPEGRTKRFEALADANSENCFEDYATYLVAMADTRAKGRMYRNALFLRRVVAAEEVSKTVATATDIQKGGAIHTSQISMIRLMSDRHNFSIAEVLDGLCVEYKMNEQTGDVNLQSLTYEDALAAAKRMREMKEEKEKNNGK